MSMKQTALQNAEFCCVVAENFKNESNHFYAEAYETRCWFYLFLHFSKEN